MTLNDNTKDLQEHIDAALENGASDAEMIDLSTT